MWRKLLTVSLIFVVSVVILITLSMYSFERFNAFVQYTKAIDHHHILRSELNQLKLDLVSLENTQRAFMLFNDSSFLLDYAAHENKIKQTFASIHEATKTDSQQQKRLRSLNLLIKSRLDFLQTDLALGPPIDYHQGNRYMEKCINVINEMEAAENQTLASHMQTKALYQETTPQNFSVVFILTMTIFAVSFGLLIQQYRDRLSYQQKLEKNVLELNQANAEWEQITHAASHDLQEPLRKLRTFSGILMTRHLEHLDEDGKTIAKRIDAVAARAQSLMQDIVNYNFIISPREDLLPVDLKIICHDLVKSLSHSEKLKNATINTGQLPVMRGYPTQISLLLSCLIDNCLKFSRAGEALEVTISASIISQKDLPVQHPFSFSHFHKIIVEDNGIGFENQFSEKIFQMFQRLHTQDSPYEGRGIGLAIVKRIMTNHQGIVAARGRIGKGSVFTLYFPVR
jgi:signal transduction histidine kinase